jgi:ABC-type oligopeptide transport system substrate-binding subunit
MEAMAKRKGQFQLYFYGWLADYADPQNFLDLLFYSKSVENGSQYNNPEVDRMLERARAERDANARYRLYQDAEALILRDAPWVPLWHSKRYVLVKPYVEGYASPSVAYPWLRTISLKETPHRPAPSQGG